MMEKIVEEVQRRLKIYLNEKRILLILRDGSDFQEVEALSSLLKEKGYTFHVISLLTKDIKVLEKAEFKDMLRIRSAIFKEEEYGHFMAGYEGLLVSDLSMLEVQAYHELYFSETLGKLIFHTIKENKPVYGFSKELKGVKNDYLKLKIEEIKDTLRKMKVHLLTEDIKMGREASKTSGKDHKEDFISTGRESRENEAPLERVTPMEERNGKRNDKTDKDEGQVLREKFITLSDVMSIEGIKERKSLKIGSHSRLTMEASDHLKRLGVRILRIEE